jgi:hypothetical protein
MQNDYDDNLREGLFALAPNGELKELPVRIDRTRALEPWLDKVPGLSRSHLYGLMRQAIASWRHRGATHGGAPRGGAAGRGGEAERLTERLVEEALLLCQTKGAPAFVLLVGVQGERRDGLLAVLRRHAVPFAEAPGKDRRPDLYYRVDGHWNRAGHAFVAELLFDRLGKAAAPAEMTGARAERRLP